MQTEQQHPHHRQPDPSDLLTVKETAVRLRVSQWAVLRHVHGETSPQLKCVRLGRRIMVRRCTLDKFITDAESVA